MATPARFSTKPHVFDGTDFSHWYSRMQSYIMAEDYDIWRKVSHTYVIPEAINTAAKKTAFEQNCKARNILLSGISCSDYDRVAHLQNAHEIWVALSNFHQGTNNIKDLRRDLFKKEYIKFEMKPGKALDDYLSRFNKILSDFRSVDSSYDANYPQSEISRHFLNGLDMSIWEMKVTSIQESVNMSTLTLDSLYTKLKTHEMNVLSRKSSFLAVFNATSDNQLEQIEEEDLALVANRIARAMNNARNRKRGGPNHCFECGSIDHLRSHCPKLGRGKREDKDGEKTNDNKPNNNKSKGSSQGRKLDNLRKAFQQVCAAFEPLSDVDGESRDDDKGKNISDVCFMAHGESDTEYEDNEVSAFEEAINILSAKNKKCEKMYRKQEFIIESLKSKIDRLKSLIPNDDDCSNCELKQPHDVLDCSTCSLNKMKLKDALGRVEFMEDVVKKNEVLSCPKCRKSKGVMVDCENCANLEKEVSYLKNSLLRFSDGEKNLNMILDQSKVLVLEVALVARKENVWIVDSGCSRHMTGDKNWFSSLKKASKTESIIFGDASTSAVLTTVFKADYENPVSPVVTCLVAKFDKDVMFWHRRLGHVGFDHLTRLSGLDLVHGLPKLKKDLDLVCTPCRHAKMVSTPHAPIVYVMTDAPGQLLHMDTVGPARVQSVRGKWYVLVIVDDFSRYSWVFFMATKGEAFQHFCGLFLRLDLEFPGSLKRIRSDNGGTLSQVQGEDGRIFEDESDDNDDDEVGLVGFTQVEGMDFDETFAPVARIEEEVYVKQPQGFENPDFPNHVFKLSKVLYGLKQAPRAWYDRLKNFLLAKGFAMGKVEKRLFVLKHGDNQLFVQIYVDDIIFGCSTHALVVDFAETMCREFEMSMMGELLYFLGLQIKQTTQGTFVHQMKYTKDLLRRFKMENCKPISTPIGSTAVLDPDEDGEAVDQKEYRSMIRSLLYLTASRPDIQFLVCLCARFQASPRASHRRAIKRIISCCSQILWLLSTLKDYCLTFEKVPLFCDNTSVINIAKNPVQHSRTKHIDIRFHFLRDRVEKGDVELQFLDIKLQLADIFTKPLDSNRFAFLRGELGIIHSFGMV
uniref:OSJNBb0002J11.7 protein n=1 Tax=Oryza sativa subsp. japonica TaxID=39947 RepID=Q7XUM5_ORYSJ|nr:OSJNBb0002J11.7 [Oryza sativa Japonica Group]